MLKAVMVTGRRTGRIRRMRAKIGNERETVASDALLPNCARAFVTDAERSILPTPAVPAALMTASAAVETTQTP